MTTERAIEGKNNVQGYLQHYLETRGAAKKITYEAKPNHTVILKTDTGLM